MGIKDIVCTACPRGCSLTVKIENRDGKENIAVSGNKCPKGEEYGKQEAVCPMRMLTTTVACLCARIPRLPVKTSAAVPLHRFPEYMRNIRTITISAPCRPGDVIVKNFCASGTDLLAAGCAESI